MKKDEEDDKLRNNGPTSNLPTEMAMLQILGLQEVVEEAVFRRDSRENVSLKICGGRMKVVFLDVGRDNFVISTTDSCDT